MYGHSFVTSLGVLHIAVLCPLQHLQAKRSPSCCPSKSPNVLWHQSPPLLANVMETSNSVPIFLKGIRPCPKAIAQGEAPQLPGGMARMTAPSLTSELGRPACRLPPHSITSHQHLAAPTHPNSQPARRLASTDLQASLGIRQAQHCGG
jgi:hypothetical protein